jgi:hypothetical protein
VSAVIDDCCRRRNLTRANGASGTRSIRAAIGDGGCSRRRRSANYTAALTTRAIAALPSEFGWKLS